MYGECARAKNFKHPQQLPILFMCNCHKVCGNKTEINIVIWIHYNTTVGEFILQIPMYNVLFIKISVKYILSSMYFTDGTFKDV